MNIKKNIKVALMALAAVLATGPLTSCSDEPDSEYFYAFTGEMMSDYLKNREQYSEFAAIVDKAELMPLLSTYGKYTCFLPDNDAVDKYLQERGLKSVDELSKEDCDTIARTHLVNNIYSTFEMTQDRLPNANLLGRYIATSQGVDADSNAVVYIEGVAHIIYEKEMPDGSIIQLTGTGNQSATGTYNIYGLIWKSGDNLVFEPVAWERVPEWQLGDVNHDRAVNVADVTDLVKYILTSGSEPEVFYPAQANVDGIEPINVADVTALIQKILQN